MKIQQPLISINGVTSATTKLFLAQSPAVSTLDSHRFPCESRSLGSFWASIASLVLLFDVAVCSVGEFLVAVEFILQKRALECSVNFALASTGVLPYVKAGDSNDSRRAFAPALNE